MTFIRALRRLPPLETSILVVAIAILTALGLASSRQAEIGPQLDSFSSFDTAGGGYAAFFSLLEREDVRVRRFQQRPAFLDASVDTLAYVEPYVFDPRAVTPSSGDVAALEAWVRGGGRLLYVGHDDDAAKHGILHLPASTTKAQAGRGTVVAPELAAAGVRRIEPSGTLRWKRPKRGFEVLFGDARGPVVVAYPFGRGRVVASIDESLFRNDAIARFDRARLAYALAMPHRPAGVVAFYETVHGYGVPDRWWTLVPRAFAIALCFALAIIFIAFAGAAIRFGPPLIPVERRDRSSADFIDALSSLLERGRASRAALDDAAASTSRAIARSLGLALGTEGEVPSRDVASRIERPEAREAYRSLAALAATGPSNTADFVRGIALAQTLRKEFAAHGRPRH